MKKYKDILLTITVFIIAPVLLVMGLSKLPHTEPMHGPPHNYWTPDPIDNIGEKMELHWDTIPNYNSFNDIPAGIHSDTIKVNGLIYKINKEETVWVLVNTEEDEIQ